MDWIAPTDRAAWRVLREELGWLVGLRVVLRVRAAQARGEPFRGLAPADTPAERASRDQAGDAIRLYRALQHVVPGRALPVAGRVIHAAALVFLDRSVGPLSPADLAALDAPARRAWVAERLARFPNVQAEIQTAEPREVGFTVHRCRLVELVREAGHGELAPLFCTADATFFGTTRPGVRLERPTTLALGGPACAFRILAEGDPP